MATWDNSKRRWKASIGSGESRYFLTAKKYPGETGKKGERGEKEADALKADVLAGPAPCRPGSVNEFVNLHWAKKQYAGETRRRYDQIYERDIEPIIGNTLLREVDSDLLSALYEKLVSESKTIKSANNKFLVASSIFAYAVKLKKITKLKENPSAGVELIPVVRRKARRDLTIEKGKAIDAACLGTDLEGPAWSSQRMALRRNEVCGLRPEDVQPYDEQFSVIRICVNRQPGETKEQLKNQIEGEYRELVVSKAWGEKLLSYWSGMSTYIFCDRHGKAIHPDTMSRKFNKLMRDKKINIKFKELRNMAISNLLRAGVPITTVADQVGHSAIGMTMVYKDINKQESADAFSRLSSAYDPDAQK